ncbi:hypothetical protein COT93_01905 [Candidatus Falkowbacteria bacterium CG10_big_fil_rev_8_21_14_0_10_37_18]|uniref:ComEC/Rec2-related protein domain-containing protein n=1 Tax=Candidatus Falkowbacteria bacterium CG10_big_fil_rev_8_21_14_0_10_37_18 TaxID=1974562 RepID=A0A2H0V905_9BACT|nr:ComEC family competence protein [Candidatus Falkowbacteria bacterium]PIR95541.1 MAG: hypothetical protein COT93_01905 [Candidatus Falkowbacteria bacterium CG10_big_fil_rev_8_21_14_0_10_37_18]
MSFSLARIFLFANLGFILFIFIGGFYPEFFNSNIKNSDLAAYNGQKISFVGQVCKEAELDYKSRRLTVCAQGQDSQGRVLITTDLYPIYDYGDYLQITGQLQAPPEIEGFDYESYLARYDVYSVMYYPKITKTEGNLSMTQKSYRLLLDFKQRLASSINSNLPEPSASLANALLLGYRRAMYKEDLNMFARVGLSHIIAISGTHITILSALIINFFLALGWPRRRILFLVGGFLFVYPILTGLAASAIRAAVMGTLSFLAIYYGRPSSLTRALVFAAAVMLAFNPRLLRSDIGFQLSFLALIGIIYIYPLGQKLAVRLLSRIKIKGAGRNLINNIFDTVNITLVSQLVILPVAVINFQQISLIAPLANLLVLWSMPFLIALLLTALLLSSIIPLLGVIWFFPSYVILKFIFIISDILARPDWAAVDVSNFSWRLGALYYLGLFLAVKFLRQKLL